MLNVCVHIQCLHIKGRPKKLHKKLSRLAVAGLMRQTLILIIISIVICVVSRLLVGALFRQAKTSRPNLARLSNIGDDHHFHDDYHHHAHDDDVNHDHHHHHNPKCELSTHAFM